MKKLLLLLLFVLSSCSVEKDVCTCTAKYSLFNQNGYFYVENTEIDCKTKLPLKPYQPNAIFCGCN